MEGWPSELALPTIQLATTLAEALKVYLGTNDNRRRGESNPNLADHVDRALAQREQRMQHAALQAVVNDLKDRIDLFRDYQRQYRNDPSRLKDEMKEFQRDIGVLLKKLSNAMFRGQICLEDLRVWAESAAFHIKLNDHMTITGIQPSDAHRTLVDIHRETAGRLCDEYRRFNPQSTESQTHEIKMMIEDTTARFPDRLSGGNNVDTSEGSALSRN